LLLFTAAACCVGFCVASAAEIAWPTGMEVPKKQTQPRRLWFNNESYIRLRPTHRDHVWSYCLVVDRASDGRPIQILAIVDEFTRECLASMSPRGSRATTCWNV